MDPLSTSEHVLEVLRCPNSPRGRFRLSGEERSKALTSEQVFLAGEPGKDVRGSGQGGRGQPTRLPPPPPSFHYPPLRKNCEENKVAEEEKESMYFVWKQYYFPLSPSSAGKKYINDCRNVGNFN